MLYFYLNEGVKILASIFLRKYTFHFSYAAVASPFSHSLWHQSTFLFFIYFNQVNN